MTTSVRQIVESFEKLTASEQVDVAVEILRRTSGMTFPPLADEYLCEIAAETFRELDEQEASQ